MRSIERKKGILKKASHDEWFLVNKKIQQQIGGKKHTQAENTLPHPFIKGSVGFY